MAAVYVYVTSERYVATYLAVKAAGEGKKRGEEQKEDN
jgi:hypothetical protein